MKTQQSSVPNYLTTLNYYLDSNYVSCICTVEILHNDVHLFPIPRSKCYIAVLKPAVVGACVPWKLENTVDQEYPVLRVGC